MTEKFTINPIANSGTQGDTQVCLCPNKIKRQANYHLQYVFVILVALSRWERSYLQICASLHRRSTLMTHRVHPFSA